MAHGVRSGKNDRGQDTALTHLGRDPDRQLGFVNPPVFRGSTVLFPTVEALETGDREFTYGRHGTPTVRGLETAVAELEGGYRSCLAPSGLAAITCALLAFVHAGDHILVTDSVYAPTRRFCDRTLSALGVETTYYDPVVGPGIANLFRENTRLVFTESPGSQTMEMQDIAAIASAARARGIIVILDNTWASPLYFKPFAHGVDVSIQAATKYIVGHADAMLGVATTNQTHWRAVKDAHTNLGLCPGPEDAYLALRGLRTMGVRLQRHWESGVTMASWLKARPEVLRVMHPALPGDPGHELWQRDFTGAAGLFSIVLRPVSKAALCAMLDGLELFGMGYSWGGYESLIVPFDPAGYRTAVPWDAPGPALRLHIGLEDVEDLKRDLEAGFDRLAQVEGELA